MKHPLLSGVVLLGITCAGSWAGSVTGVSSLGALNSTDSVGWSQLGVEGTLLTTAENWTSGHGATGEVGIVDSTLGTQNMTRRDEGNGWIGDFAFGDALLWNQGAEGQTGIDFGIVFDSPVFGGGLQIQPDYYNGFTVTITAFGGSGELGSFSETGDSTGAEDGSATFIGIVDTAPEITFLEFNVTDAGSDGDSMAIDTLFIAGQPTPEPASFLLIGCGLLGCGFLARRRRKP